MKLITLDLLLLFAFSSVAFGQGNSQSAPATKCTLTVTQAPELRDLRLGMNQAQVLARFPGLSMDRADELGLSRDHVVRRPTVNAIQSASRRAHCDPNSVSVIH